uniref:PDZ and LIM domain 3 n=1 Tax=Panthera tigris altaica TaxID=74533 RepID=A0A8C9KSL3_PANTA
MPQNVVLPGPAPWGFRLSGGIDFNQPLVITRGRNSLMVSTGI